MVIPWLSDGCLYVCNKFLELLLLSITCQLSLQTLDVIYKLALDDANGQPNILGRSQWTLLNTSKHIYINLYSSGFDIQHRINGVTKLEKSCCVCWVQTWDVIPDSKTVV